MKKINIKGALMKSAATGGGAILAASANKIEFIQKMKVPIRGILKIVAGALLPEVIGKGKKAQVVSDAGSGMIAVGALELYNGLVAKSDPTKALSISGVTEMPTLGEIDRIYVDETKESLGELPTLGETGPAMTY